MWRRLGKSNSAASVLNLLFDFQPIYLLPEALVLG